MWEPVYKLKFWYFTFPGRLFMRTYIVSKHSYCSLPFHLHGNVTFFSIIECIHAQANSVRRSGENIGGGGRTLHIRSIMPHYVCKQAAWVPRITKESSVIQLRPSSLLEGFLRGQQSGDYICDTKKFLRGSKERIVNELQIHHFFRDIIFQLLGILFTKLWNISWLSIPGLLFLSHSTFSDDIVF